MDPLGEDFSWIERESGDWRGKEKEKDQYDSEDQSQYGPGHSDEQWYNDIIRDLNQSIAEDKKKEQYLLGYLAEQLSGSDSRTSNKRNEEKEDYIDAEFTDVTDASEESRTAKNQGKAEKSDRDYQGKDIEDMTHREKQNKIEDILEEENTNHKREGRDYSEMGYEEKRKLIEDHLQNYFNEFVDDRFNFGDLKEELKFGGTYQNNEERKEFYNFVDKDLDLKEAKEGHDFYDFADEDLEMSKFKDILDDE